VVNSSKTPVPNTPKKRFRTKLQVNADELFIVQRYLSQDVPAPSDPRCLINYAKNKDRDFYSDYLEGAHEGRFEMINKDPFPLSQFRHMAIPSFKK